jgi:GntR family transcriptional regulator / MocR family aminotransferase
MTEGLDLHLGVDKGAGFVGRALETALREAIRSGRLHAGARLPGSRSLAADLGISRGTVVQAYAQLIAEGWLRRCAFRCSRWWRSSGRRCRRSSSSRWRT